MKNENVLHDIAENTPITLEMLLESREKRAARQARLLGAFKGWGDIALFSFTVNYPGDIKLNYDTLTIHQAGVNALDAALSGTPVIYRETAMRATGPEGYWVAQMTPTAAKALSVALEEEHPLGRLFDIDVLARPFEPQSRQAIGLSQRKCLLCGGAVTVCRREARHTLGELQARIHEMAEGFTVAKVE